MIYETTFAQFSYATAYTNRCIRLSKRLLYKCRDELQLFFLFGFLVLFSLIFLSHALGTLETTTKFLAQMFAFLAQGDGAAPKEIGVATKLYFLVALDSVNEIEASNDSSLVPAPQLLHVSDFARNILCNVLGSKADSDVLLDATLTFFACFVGLALHTLAHGHPDLDPVTIIIVVLVTASEAYCPHVLFLAKAFVALATTGHILTHFHPFLAKSNVAAPEELEVAPH